jgi:hypothetical protein
MVRFPPFAMVCWGANQCVLWAESAHTGVTSGRSGDRDKAAIPLPGQKRLHRSMRPYAKSSISACASAISGISGVGEKPSTAGARTA